MKVDFCKQSQNVRKSEDKNSSSEGAKSLHLAPQPPTIPLTSASILLSMTDTTAIPIIPMDDPQQTYSGFALHPDVPVESTSILYAMEDDEFEWTEGLGGGR